MIAGGLPDIVMIGTASGTQNPETLYVKEARYPLLLISRDHRRILCEEKLHRVCRHMGQDNHIRRPFLIFCSKQASTRRTCSEASPFHMNRRHISERATGAFSKETRYKSSPTDSRPKFAHYAPTHLLLTSVAWDHADLYPTEKSLL